MPAKEAGGAKKSAGAKKKSAGAKKKAAAAKEPATGTRPSRAQRAEAKRRDRIKKMRSRAGSRYRVHYDIDGPRVRLGIAWFAGAMVALALGVPGVALYFGVTFAAAGAHALRTWRARGADVDPRDALIGVAVVIAAAAVHPRAMGVALWLLAAGAIALAVRRGARGMRPAVAASSLLLQCALPTAVAGGCLVLLADLEIWSAIALVLLASAYETGDYLIGSGATNSVEGPVAGGVAVAVVALAVAALGFPPFSVGEAALFGIAVGPGAFAGQMLASVVLPHARAFAPALRRVDSLLIVAPLWYLGISGFVV
jgi:hypothetical protein